MASLKQRMLNSWKAGPNCSDHRSGTRGRLPGVHAARSTRHADRTGLPSDALRKSETKKGAERATVRPVRTISYEHRESHASFFPPMQRDDQITSWQFSSMFFQYESDVPS